MRVLHTSLETMFCQKGKREDGSCVQCLTEQDRSGHSLSCVISKGRAFLSPAGSSRYDTKRSVVGSQIGE